MESEPLDGVRPATLEATEGFVLQVLLGGRDVKVSIDHQHLHREGIQLQVEIHHMLRSIGKKRVDIAEEDAEVSQNKHQSRWQLHLAPQAGEPHGQHSLVQHLPERHCYSVCHHIEPANTQYYLSFRIVSR